MAVPTEAFETKQNKALDRRTALQECIEAQRVFAAAANPTIAIKVEPEPVLPLFAAARDRAARTLIAGRRRCRLHGGLSPGAPKGSHNGNYRNGNWTAEAIEERRWLRSLVKAFA